MRFYPLVFLAPLLIPLYAHSLPGTWPTISDLSIVQCDKKEGEWGGPCSTNVYYKAGPTVFISAPTTAISSALERDVRLYGVHCGGGRDGSYQKCTWTIDVGHSPRLLGKCQTKTPDGFELTEDSTCEVSSATYGYHTGAGPGAECAVFGKQAKGASLSGPIITPWGELSADVVANTGNQYCVKPQAPSVTCSIGLLAGGVIDHGPVAPTSVSQRVTPAIIECGANPQYMFLGGGELELSNGVQASLTLNHRIAGIYDITSVMRTNQALPGDYQASVVLIVIPQ